MKKFIVALVLIICISCTFYKSFWKETFNFQRLPQEFKNYTALVDTITDDFTITTLGKDGFALFEDVNGNYVVSIFDKSKGDNKHEILYKIGKNGTIKDSLRLPQNFSLESGYYPSGTHSYLDYEPFIIGSSGYITWLDNGDKSIKPFKEIDTEAELEEYLSKSEIVYVNSYTKTINMLRENVWYKAQIQADEDLDYNTMNAYKEKEKFEPATNLKRIYTLALGKYDNPHFYSYYESLGNLRFMFFKKEIYSGSSFWGSIGSPTGGGQGSRWGGRGYFNLQFPNSVFKFCTYTNMSDRENPDYFTEIKILQSENFAIIDFYEVKLIKMNNQQ